MSKFNEFWSKWHSDGFKDQRLGQAFCNHFKPNIMELEITKLNGPDLFYQPDEKIARYWIEKFFKRWQVTG
jgi:hypothetical protein